MIVLFKYARRDESWQKVEQKAGIWIILFLFQFTFLLQTILKYYEKARVFFFQESFKLKKDLDLFQ